MSNPTVNIEKLDQYMALKPVNEDGLTYYSPFEKPFRLAGSLFQAQHGTIFRRIPAEPEINPRVSELANYTAGFQVQFKSTSCRVSIKVKLRHGEIMQHMPQTGSSSFDLYVGGPGAWRAVRSAAFPLHAKEFSAELYNRPEKNWREYLLNFPLYNGVEELWIGLEENSGLEAPSEFSGRDLVIYGTSITQGGCASRPGMAWSNILSRRLNRQIFNFGFSGNGRGEVQMAEFIAQVQNPGAFVLDYEANAQYEGIKNTLEDFIAVLRKHHPQVPITVISRAPDGNLMAAFGANDDLDKTHPESAESCEFQLALVNRLRAAGDRNIYFIDGRKLLGLDWDECLVDGCHFTDLGFYRMAENLSKYLVFN